MPRVVIDTNVLVSASIVTLSPSARIFQAARNGQIMLLTSRYLIEEYQTTIRRPHITKKYAQVAERGDALVDFLVTSAVITPGIKKPVSALRDPKDVAILACAVEGDADYIVSGDRDLTVLKSFQRIPILTPAEFARRFKL
ncbi:MAG: putative toxin-antitoxin system toxin component, PIN family [Chloroflexi bacterium]|nr:putative toxin-antitoxin system toxin component, PIN family [Chloroflexota bacterium]